MGIWKVNMTLRLKEEFRREFDAWAEKERRKSCSMASELLVWSFDQLKVAGNLTRLLNFQLGRAKEQKK